MGLYNSKFPHQRIVNQMRQVAEHVEWTPSALCPCSSDANGANPNHVLCRGSGHVPIMSEQRLVRAMVSHFSAKFSQMDIGASTPGDIVISPMPREPVLMGPWDMIRLPGWENGEPYQGDLVTILAGTPPIQSFLIYSPQQIERAFSVTDPDSPSSVEVFYVEGVDFTVNNHVITWIHPPATGTVVSFKYRAIMEYIVTDIPDVRYERGTDIGQRVLARQREFMQPGFTAGTTGQGTFT